MDIRQQLTATFAKALIQATLKTDISLLSRIKKFLFGRGYKDSHSINQYAIIKVAIEMADEMINQLIMTKSIIVSEPKYVYLVFNKDEKLLFGCFDTEEKANKYAGVESSKKVIVVKSEVI